MAMKMINGTGVIIINFIIVRVKLQGGWIYTGHINNSTSNDCIEFSRKIATGILILSLRGSPHQEDLQMFFLQYHRGYAGKNVPL